MDNWMELQRFYNAWKAEKEQHADFESFGFTSQDGKHHIFMYQTNEYSDDKSMEWFIEVNKVVDGTHEPMDTTFAPVGDEACLMVQICWCVEKFW